MAVKGEQRSENVSNKYVGFTEVRVKAVNPTREELNALLGKEDSEDDKPLTYLTTDNDGNDRIRLSFWLHDGILDKYFPYSFNITNKERLSKDEQKVQYVNNTCITAWAPVDDESALPEWFTHFQKDRENIGEKTFHKALLGEEELAILLRAWLGKVNFSKPSADVTIDMPSLFREDYAELRELINSSYATPFVILTGVKTDENDDTKQYQQVWNKGFLPAGFMKYVKNDFEFAKNEDYSKRIWEKFEKDVNGEYGFTSYFELVPLKEYDPESDVAAPKDNGSTNQNSKY